MDKSYFSGITFLRTSHFFHIDLVLSRSVFNEIILKEAILDQTVASGGIKVSGSLELLNKFFSYFDEFEFWFNLVTP